MVDGTREVEVRERIGHDRRLARHEEEGKADGRSSSHTHHFAYAGEDNLHNHRQSHWEHIAHDQAGMVYFRAADSIHRRLVDSNRCSHPAKALLLYEVVVRIAPEVVAAATMRCDSRRMSMEDDSLGCRILAPHRGCKNDETGGSNQHNFQCPAPLCLRPFHESQGAVMLKGRVHLRSLTTPGSEQRRFSLRYLLDVCVAR